MRAFYDQMNTAWKAWPYWLRALGLIAGLLVGRGVAGEIVGGAFDGVGTFVAYFAITAACTLAILVLLFLFFPRDPQETGDSS